MCVSLLLIVLPRPTLVWLCGFCKSYHVEYQDGIPKIRVQIYSTRQYQHCVMCCVNCPFLESGWSIVSDTLLIDDSLYDICNYACSKYSRKRYDVSACALRLMTSQFKDNGNCTQKIKVNKMYILRCMVLKFCVEFQRYVYHCHDFIDRQDDAMTWKVNAYGITGPLWGIYTGRWS